MKITDLIDHVASEAGVEKSAAKKAVDAVFAGIVGAATKGEEITLPGFGKFKVKDSPARQGRNPATGATIEIAASCLPSFRFEDGDGRGPTPVRAGLPDGRVVASG